MDKSVLNKDLQKESVALHYGYEKGKDQGMSVPIFQSSAYEFDNLEQAAGRFALSELGNIYSRLTNSTCDILEKRLAALENGSAGISTASGASAVFYSIVNLAENGDNILVSDKIYGGSNTLFFHTLKRFGITAREFSLDAFNENPNILDSIIDDNTKAIFFESLSNPQIAIADLDAIVKIADKYGIISICDNTVATPILCNPLKHGVDVVVHSLSKYASGQGSVIAGGIVEREGLNEKIIDNPRYKQFNTPDESYHGLVYAKVPLPIFTLRIRIAFLRDIGACLSPHSAWLVIQGLETLKVRIYEHSSNAAKIAQFLSTHKNIESVNYPGLVGNKYHLLAKKYFKDALCSGLISFEIKGGIKEAQKICNQTKIFSIVVNIGDTKSLITHPASTTHSQLSKDELEKNEIYENTVRLSIGLENADDLIKDLDSVL